MICEQATMKTVELIDLRVTSSLLAIISLGLTIIQFTEKEIGLHYRKYEVSCILRYFSHFNNFLNNVEYLMVEWRHTPI